MKAAIKTTGFALVLFLATPLIRTEEFIFQYQRFGHISLETAKGKERVVILAHGKAGSDERTIFESPLTPAGAGTYKTPKGTVFALKQLPEPIINDENRALSEKVGLSRNTLTNLDRDDARPTLWVLLKVADGLGADLADTLRRASKQ